MNTQHHGAASAVLRGLSNLVTLACITGLVGSVSAAQITYQSPLNRLNRSADGQPLTSHHVFELGAFQPGFTPTTNNVAQWAANWVPNQRASYNTTNNLFARTFILTSNASPFTMGAPAYIWGYRASGGPPEWILMRSSAWTWPRVDPFSAPIITTGNTNATAVFGELGPTNRSPLVHMQFAAVPPDVINPKLKAEEWRQLVFPGIVVKAVGSPTSLEGDFDSDGVSNMMEFASSGDPFRPDPAGLQEVFVQQVNGQRYLALKVRKNPVADVEWAAERAPELTSEEWVTDGMVVVAESPTSTTWRWDVPLGTPGLERMFLRAQVRPVP